MGHATREWTVLDYSTTAFTSTVLVYSSPSIYAERYDAVALFAYVTTVTAGNLTLALQHSPDNEVWYDHPAAGAWAASLAQISAAGNSMQWYWPVGRHVRVSAIGASAPNINFVAYVLART